VQDRRGEKRYSGSNKDSASFEFKYKNSSVPSSSSRGEKERSAKGVARKGSRNWRRDVSTVTCGVTKILNKGEEAEAAN